MRGSRKASRKNAGAKGRQPGRSVPIDNFGSPVDSDEEREHSRVIHSGGRKESQGESRRRRRRRWWGAALIIVLLLVVGAVVLRTAPILTVSSFSVKGNEQTSKEDIIAASGIHEGQNMTRIDTHAAASHVVGLPWVTKATVERSWPRTISISVKEATVAFYVDDDGDHLFDDNGREFDVSPHPDGALKLDGNTSPDEETARAVAHVAQAVHEHAPGIVSDIDHIDAQNENNISLVFKDEKTVKWGTSNNASSKAEATKAVLQREGRVWDVSNPAQVSVKE